MSRKELELAKKILVVDDSPAARALVVDALVNDGYEVTQAENGEDGLKKLSSMSAPAAVVLDINMPVMNGLEMLEALRKLERFQSLPVLMLTTETFPKSIRRAKSAGAHGWIRKPCPTDLLCKTIRCLVD